jgi:flavodoxin I
MNIGIYFGSQTGTTDGVAALIGRHLAALDHNTTVACVTSVAPAALSTHQLLVLGASTWDIGELPYDWQRWWAQFERVDLTGIPVAIFGLGDQFGYGDTFCDAMRTLYDKVLERGGTVIGGWSSDGYEFDRSTALIDGVFIGLPLDEVNQPELTVERVTTWCAHVLEQHSVVQP